jgi:gas vesicle protein
MKTNGTMHLTQTSGLLLGFAVGASLMYLLDPQTGRRRRADVTQKMRRFGNVSEDAIEGKARHARNRAQGLVANMTSWFRRDSTKEAPAKRGQSQRQRPMKDRDQADRELAQAAEVQRDRISRGLDGARKPQEKFPIEEAQAAAVGGRQRKGPKRARRRRP